jgi:hypothetical protein
MDSLTEKTLLFAVLSMFWLIFYHFAGFEVSILLILLIIMIK